ncbi:MAG: hypothetical protein ACKVWV_19835 [Planctomycetota bacterium]
MRNSSIAFFLCLLAATACKSSTPRPAEPAVDDTTSAAQDPADPTVSPEAQFAQDARARTLGEQSNSFMVEQRLEQARTLMAQLAFDEAAREVEAALAREPNNAEAIALHAEIRALRGEPGGSAQSVTEEMNQQYALRVQQIKADALDGVRKAKMMIAQGNYAGAIAELEIVNSLVRFAPYSIDWGGLDEEARTLLDNTRATREEAERASEELQSRRAYEALQAQENVAREQKQAQIAGALDRAISAFNAGDFEEAEAIAKQTLEHDPRNEQAQEIRDAAFRAGRTKVRQDYVQNKREQFRKWQESMKELQIPWTDVITLPDGTRWNELSASRANRRGLDLSQQVTESESALRDQLRTTTVQLPAVAEEESLTKVVDTVRTITGLPLVVDPAAQAAATDAGVVFNFSFENRLSVEHALNLITAMAGENVTWTIRYDAVLVTTKEKARGKPVIINHDVQDLTVGVREFIGPRIDRLRLLDEMQDDDGGGPFGGIGEKHVPIEIADLVSLIQDNVGVGTWQDEGINIDGGEGYVLVTHTHEVQSQIRQFLEDLRRFNSSLVTIESKFMTVGANWIQEIGVDFRGLNNIDVSDVTNGLEDMASRGLDNNGSGAGEGGQNSAGHPSAGFFYDDGADGDYRGTTQNFFENPLGQTLSTVGGMTTQLAIFDALDLSAILRAVEKSANFELINDQVLSVHNSTRAYVAVINQRAYIQDFDVEVAQFQAVADPQINVLNEGVVLDVRPTIHHDRKYLTLEIQPTVAKLVALRNFSSTLGGNTSPVEFQLPELEIQSVFTTAVIPDGGSIMLGGLSSVRNIERRAEVPWFARIPIVGFFFKNEGYNDENKGLMILIRARITDVRDELKKIETAR